MKLFFSVPAPRELFKTEQQKTASPAPERWLGVKQMAELKGCSINKIRDMCHAGIIPATKEGKSWCITVSAWNTYCNQIQPKRVSTRKARDFN
jgi:excisionase family DNA binding protein